MPKQPPPPYLEGVKFNINEEMVRQCNDLLIDYLWEHYGQKTFKADTLAVVAITHDSLPTAHYITRNMNLPLYTVNSSTELHAMEESLKKYKHFVIIDDIYDTGATYEEYQKALNHFSAHQWLFLVAKQTVPYNAFAACTIPTSAYIVFPWEVEQNGSKTTSET